MEAWRKNENAESFDKLNKGAMLTVEGFFKPEEWSDQEGVKHNRVVLVATKFYETPDKEETPKEEKKTSKKKAKWAFFFLIRGIIPKEREKNNHNSIFRNYVLSNLLCSDHDWRVATTDEGCEESELQKAGSKNQAWTAWPLRRIGVELL